MLKLSGLGTALVTPFRNGAVDYDAFVALVDRQVAAGVDFLVPLGTTGETPCLSDEEKLILLQITKEHANGKPVVVGVGTNSLNGTLKNIKLFEQYEPDAFLVVAPYYNKPTQRGLYEYFKAVAASTEKAVILYNVPGRTGVNISADTTLELAKIENIIAVKEASGNYAQISRIIGEAPEGFAVLSGNDDETLALMATGAKGVISVASNIAPSYTMQMVRALQRDDMVAARSLHHMLFPLFKNCFVESNPIPVKAGLAYLGLIQNELRLPLVPATQATYELMEETIKVLQK